MKISLNRTTKTYSAGDEVTAQIIECTEKNGNLGLKLAIIENGKPGNTFFYHTIGAYADKGRFYLEQLLDHLKAAENGEIDERWFIGKRVTCVLGSYTNPSTAKTYINLGSYVNSVDASLDPVDPFGHNNDLTADVPFQPDEPNTVKQSVKRVRKAVTADEKVSTIDQRPDYTKLLDD